MSEGLRVLVCGGRDYRDRLFVYECLDKIHRTRGIAVVIHGACTTGADLFAHDWAVARNVPELTFPADWDMHGKKAGPMRNTQMAYSGAANAAIAFPGGAGTIDMIRKGQRVGIKFWTPERPRIAATSQPHDPAPANEEVGYDLAV